MDEIEDDEVTFLLKLRPSPTPPARKRRSSGGWDISIERSVVPPNVPPRKSSVTYVKNHQLHQMQSPPPPPQPSAPPHEFMETANYPSFGQMPYMR